MVCPWLRLSDMLYCLKYRIVFWEARKRMDIYQKLAAELPQMSKTQAKIANYILSHKNEVSFYNVRKLSRLVGVSEASVIRFSVFMGFKGYPELREALQEATQKHLSSKERLIISYQAYNENDILDVMKDDVNNIIQTLENTDTENVKRSAPKSCPPSAFLSSAAEAQSRSALFLVLPEYDPRQRDADLFLL